MKNTHKPPEAPVHQPAYESLVDLAKGADHQQRIAEQATADADQLAPQLQAMETQLQALQDQLAAARRRLAELHQTALAASQRVTDWRAIVARECDAQGWPVPEPQPPHLPPAVTAAAGPGPDPKSYYFHGREWDLFAAYTDAAGAVWRWSGQWARDEWGPYPLMDCETDGRRGLPFQQVADTFVLPAADEGDEHDDHHGDDGGSAAATATLPDVPVAGEPVVGEARGDGAEVVAVDGWARALLTLGVWLAVRKPVRRHAGAHRAGSLASGVVRVRPVASGTVREVTV